jgi:pSer/pThr/pTyr-binding forkhead associated (FHA) protein
MSDISVSRIHAEIRFRNNQFYIVDNTSKFGTLIKLNHKTEIDSQLNLQCGRSTYTFNQFK